jgi:hypothetical protein
VLGRGSGVADAPRKLAACPLGVPLADRGLHVQESPRYGKEVVLSDRLARSLQVGSVR